MWKVIRRLVILAVLVLVVVLAVVYLVQRNTLTVTDFKLTKELPGEESEVWNEIYLARSDDSGESWRLDSDPLVKHATQPSFLRLQKAIGNVPAGSILMYITDYQLLDEDKPEISVMVSSDEGESWTEPVPIRMESKIFFDAQAPAVVQQEDGTIRMFFTAFSRAYGSIAKARQEKITYSAISSDGFTFTEEPDYRIKGENFLNPEIADIAGKETLFLSRGNSIIITETEDKQNYTVKSKPLNNANRPAVINKDGTYLIFACFTGDIIKASAKDGYNYFARKKVIHQDEENFCDPDVIELNDNSLLMAYTRHGSVTE